MANFLKHESCPACGSRDNLARYDDGSAWCFGCGRWEPGRYIAHKWTKPPKSSKQLPVDLQATLPHGWLDWLAVRGCGGLAGHFKYSPSLDRLCFVHEDFMEARSLTREPKTLSFGTKPFLVLGSGDTTVVVEDIQSALVVGQYTEAVCLFGSVIPKDWVLLLAKRGKPVVIWLDEDKYFEAIQFSRQLSLLGVNCKVVNTGYDPKYYPKEIILDKVFGKECNHVP